MTDSAQIVDAGDLRSYRTEIPNLIDDMDLSVYAFRLYVHLKRVAGASTDGACWQSTRTLASHCGMSASKVSESKQELVEAGLIMIEQGDHPKGKSDVITIVNVWPRNFTKYAPSAPSEPVRTANTTAQTCSHSEHPVRTANTPVRVAVPKKEPIKKEPIEENNYHAPPPAAPASPPPAPAKSGGGGLDKDCSEMFRFHDTNFGTLTAYSRDLLLDYVETYGGPDIVLDAMRVAVQANKKSLRYTEGILRRWHADGRNDGPAQKTTKPTTPQSYVTPDLMADLERISHDAQWNGTH